METHTSNATLKIFKPVYSKFQQIHGRLLKKGLVREIYDESGRKYYTLTDRGFKFLEKYEKIREFIEEFGL